MDASAMTVLLAQAGWNGMGSHGGWMWGMHWLWWLFWIAVAALLIWALVSVVGGLGPTDATGRDDRESAEEVLRRRYAAGEIDEEEYRERLRVLRGEDADTN